MLIAYFPRRENLSEWSYPMREWNPNPQTIVARNFPEDKRIQPQKGWWNHPVRKKNYNKNWCWLWFLGSSMIPTPTVSTTLHNCSKHQWYHPMWSCSLPFSLLFLALLWHACPRTCSPHLGQTHLKCFLAVCHHQTVPFAQLAWGSKGPNQGASTSFWFLCSNGSWFHCLSSLENVKQS